MSTEKFASVFGHHDMVVNSDIEASLKNAIMDCINNNIYNFYIGGYRHFDLFCTQILYELKSKYPMIKTILVQSYLNKYNCTKEFVKQYFDEILYPSLEKIIPKFAIVYRNKWMIDNSDYIIFYVKHSWGGASKMQDYAIRHNKKHINIA